MHQCAMCRARFIASLRETVLGDLSERDYAQYRKYQLMELYVYDKLSQLDTPAIQDLAVKIAVYIGPIHLHATQEIERFSNLLCLESGAITRMLASTVCVCKNNAVVVGSRDGLEEIISTQVSFLLAGRLHAKSRAPPRSRSCTIS